MTDMVLPQYGMGMADGTITAWHKAVGDRVTRDEPVCDVEAAKTTVEVLAPRDGFLHEIRAAVGEKVLVNSVIAVIGDEPVAAGSGGGPVAVKSAPIAEVAPTSEAVPDPVAPPASNTNRAKPPLTQQSITTQIEPRARRAARELGVDLADILGRGPGGRIVEADVRAYVAPLALPSSAPSSAPAPASSHGGGYQLRMRCDPRPLAAMVREIAELAHAPVPLEAVLLRATALAMAQSPFLNGEIGLCYDDGNIQTLATPAQYSLLTIAAKLASNDATASDAPVLLVDWLADDMFDEVVDLAPSGPPRLSFGALHEPDAAWSIVFTTYNAAPARPDAKAFLRSLKLLLQHPAAILA